MRHQYNEKGEKMKYFYAKNRAFIEANNENRTPKGAVGFAIIKPEHGGMFFDVVNGQWVESLEDLGDWEGSQG